MRKRHKVCINILFIFALIFALFVIIPIMVSIIIGSTINPTAIQLNGTTSGWHNFWAVYLGALIGAFVPFIILYKTINNNNKENFANRQLQIRTIAYQTQIQWVNTLKTSIQQIYRAFNVLWLDEIYIVFKETYDQNNSENYKIVIAKIKEVCDRVNGATDNFRLTFIRDNDSEEQKFIEEFEILRETYCNLVGDISALSQICFHNGTDDMLKTQFQAAVDEHKSKSTQTKDDSHRLWFIADKYSMKLKSKKAYIVKDLIEAYNPIYIYEWCKNVLKYESDKANMILNDTEQDK